jgi:hypothetical protein
MNDNRTQKQQGDVTFRPVPNKEHNPAAQRGGRIVLAEGEATGHAHVVEDDEAELIREGERLLLSLTRPATVTHEEHKPITLEPGLWEVWRVSEYDYFSQMARTVAD